MLDFISFFFKNMYQTTSYFGKIVVVESELKAWSKKVWEPLTYARNDTVGEQSTYNISYKECEESRRGKQNACFAYKRTRTRFPREERAELAEPSGAIDCNGPREDNFSDWCWFAFERASLDFVEKLKTMRCAQRSKRSFYIRRNNIYKVIAISRKYELK